MKIKLFFLSVLAIFLVGCNKDKKLLIGTWNEYAQTQCPNPAAPNDCDYVVYSQDAHVTFTKDEVTWSSGNIEKYKIEGDLMTFEPDDYYEYDGVIITFINDDELELKKNREEGNGTIYHYSRID